MRVGISTGVSADLDLWAKLAEDADAGGMASCFSARITLISPATPDADSRWPILVLTEPDPQRVHGRRSCRSPAH